MPRRSWSRWVCSACRQRRRRRCTSIQSWRSLFGSRLSSASLLSGSGSTELILVRDRSLPPFRCEDVWMGCDLHIQASPARFLGTCCGPLTRRVPGCRSAGHVIHRGHESRALKKRNLEKSCSLSSVLKLSDIRPVEKQQAKHKRRDQHTFEANSVSDRGSPSDKKP